MPSKSRITPFKIAKEVISPAIKRKAYPKPEKIGLSIPRFSVAGLTIQGNQVGSVLEWNIAAALDLLKVSYNYQVAVFGGRFVPGGAVIDFEVFLVPTSVFVWAQGDYWHTRGNQEEEDMYMMARIEQELHKRNVEVWEHEALTVIQAMGTLKRELGL